jgi:hypothetical protein
VSNLRLLLGIGACAALAGTWPARADPPQPMGLADLVGARGLALSAYRGLPTGNDGIFTNPASLAARRRYSIETQWLLDHVGGQDALQVFSASVVDSETTAVTAGFMYTRALSGPWQGNLFHLPVAFGVGDSLFLGGAVKYHSLDGPPGESMQSFNLDAAAYLQASRQIGIGFAGYNLFNSGHKYVQPRAIGAGISYGDERRFHLGVDWRADFQRQDHTTHLFAVGGEYLVSDVIPIRASYLNDQTRNASFWTAGAGLVTSSGFAVDLTYRQGIEDTSDHVYAVGLKFFISSR